MPWRRGRALLLWDPDRRRGGEGRKTRRSSPPPAPHRKDATRTCCSGLGLFFPPGKASRQAGGSQSRVGARSPVLHWRRERGGPGTKKPRSPFDLRWD
ncbi:hypothetical protein PAHAL_1G320600 [Panicum hallii]|uniref:Uncharacterized protein n=1 Tax=Panicum hallii TaxID=206008 RepID=A0A2T8KWZ2_9POAL|nr:hypothetical protein PAHAL_1G320600 [Panicum hallii]